MKKLLLILTLSSMFILGLSATANAKSTGYEYTSAATHKVTVLQSKNVYKVIIGNCEANNKFKKVGGIAPGSHMKISSWIMSTGGGYVVKGYQYQPTKNTFYFVFANKHSHWFK